jgi:hypothetical protein
MVFEYISGEGTDAKSRQRWAQVKAETETAMLNMGFRDAYALRPGFIQPMRGATSRMRSIRWTSTDLLAAAMMQLAAAGSAKRLLTLLS